MEALDRSQREHPRRFDRRIQRPQGAGPHIWKGRDDRDEGPADTGLTRAEFEYGIPLSDAERTLSTICRDDTLEKQRFFVEDGDGGLSRRRLWRPPRKLRDC